MAFATSDDVAIRLGRTLTAAEAAMVDQVIASVTGQIVTAAGRDADWAADLDPVPPILKTLCVEKAVAVGSNPNGWASHSRQLGQFSDAVTYPRMNGSSAAYLTDDELAMATEALYGNAATATVPSTWDRLIDFAEDGVIEP